MLVMIIEIVAPISARIIVIAIVSVTMSQGEFQDHKVVLYHKVVFWRYDPLHSPYMSLICGRHLQFKFLKRLFKNSKVSLIVGDARLPNHFWILSWLEDGGRKMDGMI